MIDTSELEVVKTFGGGGIEEEEWAIVKREHGKIIWSSRNMQTQTGAYAKLAGMAQEQVRQLKIENERLEGVENGIRDSW